MATPRRESASRCPDFRPRNRQIHTVKCITGSTPNIVRLKDLRKARRPAEPLVVVKERIVAQCFSLRRPHTVNSRLCLTEDRYDGSHNL